ncbi:TetR/AcrR family transcriptional regulator [Arenivirga flava]|uniref:TetR family transcriptional regulator n=1 Tax=Arenivirga flava TaxID=1930060 RepID=A0AA37XCF3_9MICO|nr:TetR/AcrR family transcriptional regulator [Arenivirga flava]GMA29835.1 TetR family transcriptional regulator [Arenivirga flava]
MRSDTERNRRHLLRAAGELDWWSGAPVRMSDIAERAGVSAATAYRHFSSVADLFAAYRTEVGEQLRAYSRSLPDAGQRWLYLVCEEWVRLVLAHGVVMVHTRSDDGYLRRLRSGAGYLTAQAEALHEPIRSAARELDIADPGDVGLFLWNILFDPREVFDLRDTELLDGDQITGRLVGAFVGALHGWQQPPFAAARETRTTRQSRGGAT